MRLLDAVNAARSNALSRWASVTFVQNVQLAALPRRFAVPGQIQSLGISLGLLVVAWAVLAWPWLVDGQIIPWDA